MRHLLAIAAAALLISTGSAHAQNGFVPRTDGFAYTVDGRAVEVPLSRQAVTRSDALLDSFNATRLSEVVSRDVEPYLRREYGALVDVRISPTSNGYRMNWQVPKDLMSAALRADVVAVAERAEATYYRERFMRTLQPGALYPTGVVVPDYPRLTTLFEDDMAGLAEAVRQHAPGSLRSKVAFLTRFLQDIPYRALSGRDPRDGYGVLPPASVLSRNEGDCDSKALVFASVMRLLAPSVPVAFVLVDGHAFLGVGFGSADRRAGDLLVPGTDLVVVEPVGPGRLPVGQAGEQSLSGLRSGKFYILPVDAPEQLDGPLEPRRASLLATTWSDLGWTTRFVGANGREQRVVAALDRSLMRPTEPFNLDTWQDQVVADVRHRLSRDVASHLDLVAGIELNVTGSSWSWRVLPDQDGYRRLVAEYNQLVERVNGLGAFSSERDAMMAELDQRRAVIDAFSERQSRQVDQANARARAVIDDARVHFEADRHVVTRDQFAMLDLGSVAASYVDTLAPLARSIGAGQERRAWLEGALTLLQAQPVRGVSNSRARRSLSDSSLENLFQTGIATPRDKAIVLAAMTRARFPDLPVTVVEAGQSAFVLTGISAEGRDRAFTVGAETLVAADPAGPIHQPVGTLRDYFDEVPVADWRLWPVPLAG